MLSKRIIPCLDVKDGRVVKGVEFKNLRDVGDPVEAGARYSQEGADELVFLDIAAAPEKRKTRVELVDKISREVFIPFTVGGGINTVEDISTLLRAGADKVSINTRAVKNPDIIKKASRDYGRQCIVAAIDAKKIDDEKWEVYICGGREPTGLDVLNWSKKVEQYGAGEILLTSMDADGTKDGYDLDLTRAVSSTVNIPVIASGGAGSLEHIYRVFKEGKADAALAASIFHFGKYSIQETKAYLKNRGIEIRD